MINRTVYSHYNLRICRNLHCSLEPPASSPHRHIISIRKLTVFHPFADHIGVRRTKHSESIFAGISLHWRVVIQDYVLVILKKLTCIISTSSEIELLDDYLAGLGSHHIQFESVLSSICNNNGRISSVINVRVLI